MSIRSYAAAMQRRLRCSREHPRQLRIRRAYALLGQTAYRYRDGLRERLDFWIAEVAANCRKQFTQDHRDDRIVRGERGLTLKEIENRRDAGRSRERMDRRYGAHAVEGRRHGPREGRGSQIRLTRPSLRPPVQAVELPLHPANDDLLLPPHARKVCVKIYRCNRQIGVDDTASLQPRRGCSVNSDYCDSWGESHREGLDEGMLTGVSRMSGNAAHTLLLGNSCAAEAAKLDQVKMADDTLLPSFTCTTDDRTDLWPEIAPMSYSEANAVGRERASELIAVIRRTSAPSLLGHVIEAIAKRNIFGGVEVGFFHALSRELIAPTNGVVEFVEIPGERQFPVARQLGHLRVVGGGKAG